MIKSLSPYYLTIPFIAPATSTVCTSYTLYIFIWDGLKSSVPATPTYEITKKNPTASTGNDKVNIARLIADFIDFTPVDMTVTDLYNANNQIWIRTQVTYITGELEDLIPTQVSTELMVKGYSYGMDGENQSTPANKILLSGTEFKVDRNGFFNLPILIEETTVPLATLEITLIEETVAPLYDITYTETGTHDDILYRYRLQPSTVWVLGLEVVTASPFNGELPAVAGDYDVQLLTYDTINNEVVYSNIYVITIT